MAKTMEEVLERFRTIEFHDDFDMIVAIANGGIVPAGIINQRLQKEVHLLRINLRDEYQLQVLGMAGRLGGRPHKNGVYHKVGA